MKRKKFNRGTMTGGIIRICVAIVAIIIAVTILSSTISSWDKDEIGGSIFMCFIAGIIICASIYFIVNGVKMVIDGKKSLEVLKNGHSESGRILDLTETEVTENHNGAVSHYIIYNLKFEYTDDFGDLAESEEQVSKKVYDKLKELELIPIVVYKERAVFDKNKFVNL